MKLNLADFNNGLSGHVDSDLDTQRRIELIQESISCGAFESASFSAENLAKTLFTRHEYESMKRGVK